jgi:alpha-amylase
MKKILSFLFVLTLSFVNGSFVNAQGWPANYRGVMLQGFYWDSYSDTQWTNLESQADELSQYFDLIWVPNSGYCNTTTNNMGYFPIYWYKQLSAFGTETQLRSMIKTFKAKGTGIIADAVINHRNGVASYADYPAETYNGQTWQLTTKDICNNDDAVTGGYIAKADAGNADTGLGFDGARDLDHTSANVQKNVISYLRFLKDDIGYTGFRYDFVKGYAPQYTAMYNDSVQPTYSVGECWDGSYSVVTNWLNGTKLNGNVMSAAFDFVLKYQLNSACNYSTNWNKMASANLANTEAYKRYAVTFVDNHDTYRDNNKVSANDLAANAFILCTPGTPCVFLPHWTLYKKDIKQLITLRKMIGVSNQSATTALSSSSSTYALQVSGDGGKSLVIVMGGSSYIPQAASNIPWVKVISGKYYTVYAGANAETVWSDTPSGTYDNSVSVKLNVLTTATDAKIVYTTDNSEPSASNGTQVADGSSVDISASTILKAGILSAGTVTGIITRSYTIQHFTPHQATVYVQKPADWPSMNFYAWDTKGTLLGSWPGTTITDTKELGGKTWYCHAFDISSSDYKFNIIFDYGTSSTAASNQTIDIDNLNSDKFYTLSSSKNSAGKYEVTDVTDQYSSTGIDDVTVGNRTSSSSSLRIFTVDGRMVREVPATTTVSEAMSNLAKGVYIVNGRKMVKQ